MTQQRSECVYFLLCSISTVFSCSSLTWRLHLPSPLERESAEDLLDPNDWTNQSMLQDELLQQNKLRKPFLLRQQELLDLESSRKVAWLRQTKFRQIYTQDEIRRLDLEKREINLNISQIHSPLISKVTDFTRAWCVALLVTLQVNTEFKSCRLTARRRVDVTVDPAPSGSADTEILLFICWLLLYHLTSGRGLPPEEKHSITIVDPSSSGPTRITSTELLLSPPLSPWIVVRFPTSPSRSFPLTRTKGSPGVTKFKIIYQMCSKNGEGKRKIQLNFVFRSLW